MDIIELKTKFIFVEALKKKLKKSEMGDMIRTCRIEELIKLSK